jgi:hypothetical protein
MGGAAGGDMAPQKGVGAWPGQTIEGDGIMPGLPRCEPSCEPICDPICEYDIIAC